MLPVRLLPLLITLQHGVCTSALCQGSEVSEPMAYCDIPLRRAADAADPGDLISREHELATVPPHTAADWIQLSCVRSALMQWQRTSHEYFPTPTTRVAWHEPALAAALTAARATPSDTTLLLLSSLVLRGGVGRPDPIKLGLTFYYGLSFSPSIERVVQYARDALPLLQRWVNKPSPDSGLLRACTSIALDIDEFGVAHECSVRALTLGYEPAWNRARLAWLAAQRADTAGAFTLFGWAVDGATTSPERLGVAWHFKAGIDTMNFPFWGITTGSTSRTSSDYRQDSEFRWLNLAQSDFRAWLDAQEARGSTSKWRSLTDPAVLADHFATITFGGEVFRDCLRGDEAATCRGKDLWVVHARRLRFWDAHGGDVALFTFMTMTQSSHDSMQVVVQQGEFPRQSRSDTLLARGDSALISVPSNNQWDSWSLDIDPKHPARRIDFQDYQAPLGAPPIILSDLAVGSEHGALTWMRDGKAIAIAPSMTFTRDTKLQLFFQVRCDSDCGEIRRAVNVRPVGRNSSHRKSVSVSNAGALVPGINDITEELDLHNLGAGAYRLELAIQRDWSHVVKRSTVLVLR
jgi:hypothetical protein